MLKNLEVLKLMSHLLITLAIIGGYLYSLIVLNAPDETLKIAIFTILGYWFGAIGMNKSNKSKGTDSNE